MKIGFIGLMVILCAVGTTWTSRFISVEPEGELVYTPDELGNIIPDFSRVGYHQGDRRIPDVKEVLKLSPKANVDHSKMIQEAIDQLSRNKPDADGFRGAILLTKGDYHIQGTLKINTGGIVLRGEGDHEGGTRMIATGKGKRSLISIRGEGKWQEVRGSRTKIREAFVPTGSKSFEVASSSGFSVGDEVMLYRPGTQKWIEDIQMNKIIERQGTRQWTPEEYNLAFERKITKIAGNKIWLDNPAMMPMEEQYGGGEIFKYAFPGRISEVGIEHIRFESEFAHDTDEDHGWIAVEMDKIENAWVRNITSKYFGYACVSLSPGAKQVTVMDSQSLDPKSVITGGKRYSFNNNGQLNLFMNLHATDGRHDYVTGAKVLGPNVFYNCTAENTHADIGPHHRWAVGTLYDNIRTDGEINVQDRGNWGSGHGWSGVTQVVWNCVAKKAAVQSPWASGKNYCIGLIGEKVQGRFADKPDGEWEGHNQKGVNPTSLYMAQLNARLALSDN